MAGALVFGSRSEMLLEFGSFTFDSARCTLVRDSKRIHLTRKAFVLLEMLLQQRPAVVLKRQIMDALWPD
jgi:DNA-binding winged helix-turn-helix (wHTH) protein